MQGGSDSPLSTVWAAGSRFMDQKQGRPRDPEQAGEALQCICMWGFLVLDTPVTCLGQEEGEGCATSDDQEWYTLQVFWILHDRQVGQAFALRPQRESSTGLPLILCPRESPFIPGK